MTPPSTIMVSRGAWVRWASTEAIMGAPTPVNTVVSLRSSRAPITASSSFAVTRHVVSIRARAAASARRASPKRAR